MDDTGIKTEIRNGERPDAETEAFETATHDVVLLVICYLLLIDVK